MSIYEDILELEQKLDNCFNPETGEIDIEKEQALINSLQDRIDSGLEYLCKSRANKLNEVEGLKSEESRIKGRRQRQEKSIERLEGYMLEIYKKANAPIVKAGSFTLSTRKSTIVQVDPNFSNKDYEKIKTELDKAKLKNDLKAGVEIAGAYLVDKDNLQVK